MREHYTAGSPMSTAWFITVSSQLVCQDTACPSGAAAPREKRRPSRPGGVVSRGGRTPAVAPDAYAGERTRVPPARMGSRSRRASGALCGPALFQERLRRPQDALLLRGGDRSGTISSGSAESHDSRRIACGSCALDCEQVIARCPTLSSYARPSLVATTGFASHQPYQLSTAASAVIRRKPAHGGEFAPWALWVSSPYT
jgi:hypothetical protein